MTMQEIADAASFIIDGYAMEVLDSGMRITNLHRLDHVAFLSPKGEVLETTMDDIELHIAILMSEIQKGRDSVRTESDWVSEEEMLSHFGVTP